MKKWVLVAIMVLFWSQGHASATELMETEKEVEVTDEATKTFIYQSLDPWITLHVSDMYKQKYQTKHSIGWTGPKPEKIRIWMKEVKPGLGEQTYTHVVRVYLPFDEVTLDNNVKMVTADTFIYAVNATQLSACPDGRKLNSQVKLIKWYHKVLSQ